MWTFPQHSCNIEQFKKTMEIIKTINGTKISEKTVKSVLTSLENEGVFKPKENGTYHKATYGHKILDPFFYGGLYVSNERLHLSPYGNLLLKHWEEELNRSKIFLSMLFSIQYPNVTKKKVHNIELYPFRLIFNLMNEEILDFKISNIEISYILYFITNISCKEDYDKIVEEIYFFRNKSIEEQLRMIHYKKDDIIKNIVSFRYVTKILSSFKIIEVSNFKKVFAKMHSSKRKEPTNISYYELKINNELLNYYLKIKDKYTIFDSVVKNELPSDFIRIVYNFVAPELLFEIGEPLDRELTILQMPSKIIKFSKESEFWEDFEGIINSSFNMFDDLESEQVGGAAEPDIVCKFSSGIFTVDTKSTKKSLNQINSARIEKHMKKHGGIFSLIITPKYRKGAEEDLNNTKICLITSYCFADLISKYVIPRYEKKEDCDFDPIVKIITNNLGRDISSKIYEFIDEEVGV